MSWKMVHPYFLVLQTVGHKPVDSNYRGKDFNRTLERTLVVKQAAVPYWRTEFGWQLIKDALAVNSYIG